MACSTSGTIYKKDTLGPNHILSLDARQRLVIQGTRDDQQVTCSEPSPDAISAQAAQIAASTSVPLSAQQVASGQVAAGYSEAAASIAMRTQSIQLLRDGYYRLCEAYMNGVLDKGDYRSIILFIDEFIATVVAIEAIGGTVQTAPVGIYTTMNASADKDNADADSTGGATFPAQLTVNASQADAAAALQIRLILKRYYARKKEYQKLAHQQQ